MPRAHRPALARGVRSGWLVAAAAATAAAGVLHAVAAVDHLAAGPWAAPFFAGCAAAQLATAGWLLATRHPAPRVVGVLLAGTAGLIVLYVLVHGTHLLDTVAGHDLGADQAGHGDHDTAVDGGAAAGVRAEDPLAAGHPIATEGPVSMGGLPGTGAPEETPEGLGTLAVAVELVAVGALTALLPARLRSRAADTLLLLGTLAILLWLTGLLF